MLKSYKELTKTQRLQADRIPVDPRTTIRDKVFRIVQGNVKSESTNNTAAQPGYSDWGFFCQQCRVAFSRNDTHAGCNSGSLRVVRSKYQGKKLESLPNLRQQLTGKEA